MANHWSLLLSEKLITQMGIHALHTYPEECCGILFGRVDRQVKQKTVITLWETENNWQEQQKNLLFLEQDLLIPLSQKNRFAIAPQTLFKAQKYAREQDFAIIGIYHSHPDHSAIPSPFDRAIAWLEYSYLIVSVEKQRIKELKSWSLDEQEQFQLETIVTIQSP